MKNGLRKVFPVFILLMLCMLLPAAVYAEGGSSSQNSAGVIAGFEPLGDGGAITIQYKLALVTLEKQLPAQLSVRLEGDAAYQRVPVTWKCVENYDEVYDTYHFEPVFNGFVLAEGARAPVVSVHVSGESDIPVLRDTEDDPDSETPELILSQGKSRGTAPTSYNSYEAGRLPAVRNQAPYNSCWAFSAVGTIEADLIAEGAADTDVDLSEVHLAYYTYHGYYDEKGCGVGDQYDYTDPDYMNAGGMQSLAIKVLSNQIGPATEETVPYEWGNNYRPGPLDGRAFSDVQLENAYAISAADTAGIKAAIQAHGAVSAPVYWNNEYYSYTYNSYFCPKSKLPNHDIMLVGWDDSFSRDNFSAGTPKTDGAWLVRNSWGLNNYGREGYFWLSYSDPSFLRDSVYVYDATNSQYDHCYSYGTVPNSLNVYSFSGSVTAVQHFMVDGGEKIVAVGFETLSSGLNVRIELTLGSQTAYAASTVNYPGYYTVELSEPIDVIRRSDVTLTMVYEGDDIQIPTEYAGTVSYSSDTSTGFCGSGGLILNGENTGEDGLIKLFTVDCDVPGEEGVRINAANFPDTAFRNYISSSFDTDRNGYLNDSEIAAVTVMDFIPAGSAGKRAGSGNNGVFKTPGPVKSLSGLSFFTELRTLSCAGNRLTALDVSRNTKLQQLYCDDNQIADLDLSSNTALSSLSCTGNPLTDLDISSCPALVELIGNTLPDLDMYSIVFSDEEGRYLAFDLGVNLTPPFNLGEGLPIDENNFPDAVFRSYLSTYCDLDGDGTLTDHELSAVKYIDCSGSDDDPDKIASLEGIKRFPSLEKLLCGNNLLTALDLSGNSALQELSCPANQIEQLDLQGNPDLRVLDCHDNQDLAALNLSGCAAMLTLDCSGAGLTSLDLSDCSLLEKVNCGDNPFLETLDISTCTGLQTLSCGNTQVPALSLNGRRSLTRLECGGNSVLTTVNVNGCSALTVISCNDCLQLTTLDIRGCGDLNTLECRNGNLTRLNLNSCTWLSNMTCYGNRIAVLDLLPSYALSAITECYEPVIDNGIAFYNYEGHKIAFDAGTVLVNIEPDLVLPEGLKTIEDEAFEGGAFRHVVLSDMTDLIGANAFAGCDDLFCVRIPNGEAHIDSRAFGNRTGIVIFGISGGTAETFAQAHNCFFIPIE